jgi:hypothetical protein
VTEYVRDLARFQELNNSFPMDPERRLRGEPGVALRDHALSLMRGGQKRVRRLNDDAADSRARTVEALLANVIVAALHKLNPSRYVAVPFNRNRYKDMGLSHDAMVLARDTLVAAGLIEYNPGYRRQHHIDFDFLHAAQLARIRAEPALRDLFDELGVRRWHVTSQRDKLIKLNRPRLDAGPEPAEVTASRSILARLNARIDGCDIRIPDEAWQRIAERRREKAEAKAQRKGKSNGKPIYVPSGGDLTAKSLYRAFTGDWNHGGRLYGGWWQNIEGEERRLLTIDGEPTVEIDFGNLHPALLYKARGKRLDRDPYHLPPYSRDLCKETFQRLINRSNRKGGADIKRAKDHKPPSDISFETFLGDYKNHLSAVADLFGKNVGTILQREDSDLALQILGEMDKLEIVTLPIHDSFMVSIDREPVLRATMARVYQDRYDIKPNLKTTSPLIAGYPETP